MLTHSLELVELCKDLQGVYYTKWRGQCNLMRSTRTVALSNNTPDTMYYYTMYDTMYTILLSIQHYL